MQNISSLSFRSFLLASAGLLAIALPSTSHAGYWLGADGDGGDGVWNTANFEAGAYPSGSTPRDSAYFDTGNDSTEPFLTALSSTISVNSGVTALNLNVRNYLEGTTKSVVINIGDGRTLNVGSNTRASGTLGTGGAGAVVSFPAGTSLTVQGPATGTGNLRAARLYVAGHGAHNSGTEFRHSMLIDGTNLSILLDGRSSSDGVATHLINNRGDMTFRNADVVTAVNSQSTTKVNGSGSITVQAGSTGNPYENWVTFDHSTINLHTIEAQSLFQISSDSYISATRMYEKDGVPTDKELTINVGNGTNWSRFEVAGDSIDPVAVFNFKKNAILAIGLSDPHTMARTEAESFTLNQTANFLAESLIEFNIFGSDAEDADKLIIGETGSLVSSGTGPQIVLKLNGYTLQAGDEWSLIDTTSAANDWLTGGFDLTGIDTNLWDLSDFNAAGNWTVRSVEAIPEPSTFALLGFTALAAAGWMKRRRSA